MATHPIAKTSFLGLVPFGLEALILLAIAEQGMHVILKLIFLSIAIFGFMYICGYSWVAIFPRWTFHALGFCGLFTICYLFIAKGQSEFAWLWIVLPLILAFVAGFCVKPNFKLLYYFYWLIKADKSLLLFWLYGFLPAYILFLFRDIKDLWHIPVFIIIILIQATGAFFYLQSPNKTIRVLSLFLGAFVAFATAIIYMVNYWVG